MQHVIALIALTFALPVFAQGDSFKDCEACPEMVIVPPGSFLMGSARKVTIARSLAVGRTEVTFAQWDACIAERGCSYRPDDQGWGRGDQPLMNVTWENTREYLAWLKRKTGRDYRLLTDAEWEYVARAGSTTDYFWGDSDAEICQYAAVDKGGDGCGKGRPLPAGQLRANAFGLQDTLGSMYEWVEDCWNADLAGVAEDGSARIGGDCGRRVLRGGSWKFLPQSSRSVERTSYLSFVRAEIVGFRVAISR
jgi:formylglycine-generating enzyme required for sulfatase activity